MSALPALIAPLASLAPLTRERLFSVQHAFADPVVRFLVISLAAVLVLTPAVWPGRPSEKYRPPSGRNSGSAIFPG